MFRYDQADEVSERKEGQFSHFWNRIALFTSLCFSYSETLRTPQFEITLVAFLTFCAAVAPTSVPRSSARGRAKCDDLGRHGDAINTMGHIPFV